MNKNTLTWVLVALAVVLVLYMMYKKNDSGDDAGTSKSKLLGGSSSGSSGGSSGGNSSSGGGWSDDKRRELNAVRPSSHIETQKQWVHDMIADVDVANILNTAGWYDARDRNTEEAFEAALRDKATSGAITESVRQSILEHVTVYAFIGYARDHWNSKANQGHKFKDLLNSDGRDFIGK